MFAIGINRLAMIRRKEGFTGERAIVLPRSILQEMEADPLSSVLYITDIGYYPKAQFHFRERRQPISQYVLIYCIEGKGWYRVDGQEYAVEAGQYFVLPAGKAHAYGADGQAPWTIYWIHFKGKLASRFASPNPRPIEVRPGIQSRINDRIALFDEILRTLELGYSHENLLYACSILHHFLATLRYLSPYRAATHDEIGNGDIVIAAIHFMKEHIERKLSLRAIAEHTGYSPSHLSALFSGRTGYSPLAYFNQLKIQRACQLLDFTDMRINQICYKIGIEDSYYFSRLFRKIMGMSPTAYRELKKG